MQDVRDAVQRITVAVGPDVQGRLILSVATIVLIWLARRLILRIIWRQSQDIRFRYRWRKYLTYAAGVVALLIIGRIWVEGFRSILTFLGLVSAGLAVALRDLVVNLAGWVFIIARRPFVVGDRVQVGDRTGDVIDLRVFQFTLLEVGNWVDAEQSTGRLIHVPNGKVFNESLANYTRGFKYLWNELPVLVTFESDWKAAKRILEEIVWEHGEDRIAEAEKRLVEASRRFMIFYSSLTPIVYTSVKDSGIMLTIRYLCEPRGRRGSEEEIWEQILDRFGAEDDIDFAYPTQRWYNNLTEGKPGARAVPPEGTVPG